jgi:hypothetical protein
LFSSRHRFGLIAQSFGDIPIEEKLGEQLKEKPLSDEAEFVDIELWKMDDPQKNTDFIDQLKASYPESTARL